MPSDLTTTPISADLVRGAVELEPTAYGVLPHRLPAAARRWADAQLAFAESQPSGVRLAFRTRASRISLETVPTKQVYAGAPPRPDGVYDLVVDGRLAAQGTARGGHTMTVDMVTGRTELTPGEPVTVDFDDLGDHEKDVEVWLPWNERTELVALHADAPVAPAAPGSRLWLHHGSSISHGSDTASPTGTWPAVAASLAGVDLLNLGFGGSALLDPFVARAIRDLPADLISLKLGINVVNHDAMRLRAFTPAVHGFLDTIREGRPTTPLLLVSPICCPIHEETPGPTEMDLAAFGEGRLGLPGGRRPGRGRRRPADALGDPSRARRRRRAARRPEPGLPRRARAVRRGGRHGAAAARRPPPGPGGAPPDRGALRGPRTQRGRRLGTGGLTRAQSARPGAQSRSSRARSRSVRWALPSRST
jgi:hypothetical protein